MAIAFCSLLRDTCFFDCKAEKSPKPLRNVLQPDKQGASTMTKSAVFTDKAPAAVGHYSQAIITGNLVFTAGQTGLIPGTRNLVEGGVQEQTRQTLTNVKTILEAAGSSLDKVVKTTVFLADINDFAAMNEIYATFF